MADSQSVIGNRLSLIITFRDFNLLPEKVQNAPLVRHDRFVISSCRQMAAAASSGKINTESTHEMTKSVSENSIRPIVTDGLSDALLRIATDTHLQFFRKYLIRKSGLLIRKKMRIATVWTPLL